LIRNFVEKTCECFAVVLFVALIAVTVFGRNSMTPPGWVAVLITLLPYLYFLLFLLFFFSFIFFRKRRWVMLMTGIVISCGVIWGSVVIPDRTKQDNDADVLNIMTWNIQRMGEYSGSGGTVNQKIYQISSVIREKKPDIVSILEITKNQMDSLKDKLDIPEANFIWSDYYGTGNSHYAGLAICLLNKNNGYRLEKKRKLELPPNWKYVYAEVCRNDEICMNFLAVHVVPPKITKIDIKKVAGKLIRLEENSLNRVSEILKNYEIQVKLQGKQATQILDLLKNFKDPTIVAGDFNCTRDAALHIKMRENLIDTWSQAGFGPGPTRYWSDILPLRIDYIYVTRDFKVINSHVFKF